MKIAISSSGNTLESTLDSRFGRAAGFIVYDTDSGNFEYKDNTQNLNAAQGAGIQSAQNVADTGAEAVITGHVGPKAFRALDQAKIRIYLAESGTVADAVERFKSGAMQPVDGPDKEGHW
ncbi:NifB/NifX family molybdenum-iron cluster-binding protein [Salidesulfovibrio brasiliensis]|uniref:NifB/NifX family molybdenum-iron cluster-binding protein n=1 Tax=Salidesulfovibrio brasiliensis TaxID=221711 RepID=UPI0006D12EC9|nr:NifB/NifX family molybdenum-iron cluster-binding protein [Salidesulfovibrio brasiliensis]